MAKMGVYLIVSPSGGRYVGSSTNIHKRWNRYKNLSCKGQSAILASLKKHGAINHKFSILFLCDRNDLFFWERTFGNLYLSLADFPNGLNIILPSVDDVPVAMSASHKAKISKTQIERFSSQEQRQKTSQATRLGFTQEVREKMREIHTKRFESAESRERMSFQRLRFYKDNPQAKTEASNKTKDFYERNPQAKEAAINVLKHYYKANPHKAGAYAKTNIKGNKEFGVQQSAKLKKFYNENPQARAAASEKSKDQFSNPENNVRSKKVIDVTTQEVFPCAKDIAKNLKVPVNTFYNWLKGKSPNPTNYRYL